MITGTVPADHCVPLYWHSRLLFFLNYHIDDLLDVGAVYHAVTVYVANRQSGYFRCLNFRVIEVPSVPLVLRNLSYE
jgi:hypothetical protein